METIKSKQLPSKEMSLALWSSEIDVPSEESSSEKEGY